METFDLTQTGAQVQDILDKAAQLPSKATLDTELNAKADKSNTYTKAEVDQLVQTLENGSYERVDTYEDLGDPTEEKAGIIWLVGAEDAEEFDRYIIGKSGDTYEWVYMGTTAVDLTGKADKVADATDGDLAGLDENGNLTDSRYKPSDFATAAQGAKADSAYRLPGSGIPVEDLATSIQNTLGRVDNKADKVGSGHTDKLATFNSAGNLKDSGIGVEDVALKASSNPAMLVGSALGIMGNTPQAALYTHRAVPAGAGSGAAQMRLLRGNSLVWNQLIKNGNFADGSTDWRVSQGTITAANGELTIAVTGQLQGARQTLAVSTIVGHKYLMSCRAKGNAGGEAFQMTIQAAGFSLTTTLTNSYAEYTLTGTANSVRDIVDLSTTAATIVVKNVRVYDLTMLGIDTMTKEQAIAWLDAYYPATYHAYNSGTIKNLMATGVLSDGFNQFDKSAISTGKTVDKDTGAEYNAGSPWNASGYIRVIAGETYYLGHIKRASNAGFCWYDASKQYIDGIGVTAIPDNGLWTAPAGSCYIRFSVQNDSLDICVVNRSSARNGQYEPYRSYTLGINIPTLKGKAGGVGDSVVIYPDGMMSAGTAFDYGRVDADGWMRRVVKVMERIDMGTLDYTKRVDVEGKPHSFTAPILTGAVDFQCVTSKYTKCAYGDVREQNLSYIVSSQTIYLSDNTFDSKEAIKVGNAGVYLEYQLATPVEYVLDTPIYMGYPVDADGTETMLPDQTGLSEPTSAPIDYDVVYPIDLAGNLATELNAMLTANSLAGSFSKNGNGGVTYSAE